MKDSMEKYGSVYTPDNLADFASFLIFSQIKADVEFED